MGTKYTTQSISGYNASPPPDDGTTGDDNKSKWSQVKTKIGDPVKTLAESVNTALVAMVDVVPLAKSGAYTTVAGDNGRLIEASGTYDQTLGATASMGAGYSVGVKNTDSGTITLKTGDTIDGSASDRTLAEGQVEWYTVNAAADGYMLSPSDAIYGTSLDLATGASVTGIADENDMSSDSDTLLATQQSIKAYIDSFLPVGAVQTFAKETPPSGWLECDGSSLERSGTYANLFGEIGTAFGTADGTHFNIPDLQGVFVRGWANSDASDPNRATRTASGTGGATGDNVGSYQADEYESHDHDYGDEVAVSSGAGSTVIRSNQDSDATTASSGGSETRPKNVYLMYCIKY